MIDLSLIIINFNSKKYIKNCIKSCINQKTQFKYEILVIDDASTDHSLKEIGSFKFKFLRVFKNKKNMGIEKTSNFGLRKAKGKYVCRVDSDDLIQPNFIDVMLKNFKKKYSFLYSNYNVINASGKMISKKKLPEFNKSEILLRGDFLATGTVFRKSILERNNYYQTKTKNSGLENFELILKLIIKNNYLGHRINKFLFSLRKHTSNISKVKKRSIKAYGNKIMKKMKLGSYSININHPNIL